MIDLVNFRTNNGSWENIVVMNLKFLYLYPKTLQGPATRTEVFKIQHARHNSTIVRKDALDGKPLPVCSWKLFAFMLLTTQTIYGT